MKKKILLMTTIASLLLSGATACGCDTADSQTGDLSAGSAESEATATADAESESEDTSEETSQSQDSVAIDQVIYDQDGITVTADSIEAEEAFPGLVLTVQNNSDGTVFFEYRLLTVNGIRIDSLYNDLQPESFEENYIPYIISEASDSYSVEEILKDIFLYDEIMVSAGESETVAIAIDSFNDFTACFGDIQTISFTLNGVKFTNMESPESLEYELLPETEVNIETDAFNGELEVPEITGTDIYNKNGIRIVMLEDPSLGEFSSEYSEFSLPCYFENTTDKVLGLCIEEFSVNDYACDVYFGSQYLLNNEAFLNPSGIYASNPIPIASTDDISDMEFTIVILAADSQGNTEEIDRTTFTYTP